MKILVTGAAGFIGFHVAARLLDRGDEVVGLDNLNSYYDVRLKEARLARLTGRAGFRFARLDLADREGMGRLFEAERPQRVIHLAAQAGVRYSLENPHAYVDANLVGFLNILEPCRRQGVEHLVYASSSSVYGANVVTPFSVHHNVDHPVSLYAATKKANELMAHTYSHLFGLPTTGLRFFTVYGPWGRPDMALFKFTKAILEGRPIEVYNHGEMWRDFTYIDDIVEGVVRVAERVPNAECGMRNAESLSTDYADSTDSGFSNSQSEMPNSQSSASGIPHSAFRIPHSNAPYRLYNIGNNQPVRLTDFIEVLERCLGRTAQKQFLPLQPGDVVSTYADISDLERDTGFRPSTPIEVGIARFVEWYREFYGA